MSTSIGRGALILTTDQAGLDTGLPRAKAKIDQFGTSAGASLKSRLGGAGLSVGQVLSGGIAAGLAAGFASSALNAVQSGATQLVTGAVDKIKEMADTGTQAAAFGLTVERWSTLAGVAKFAGANVKEFVESMTTVNQIGIQAAQGTETAVKVFERLGLNAAEFNKLDMDQKFFAAQEALSKVADAGDRLTLAGNLFGTDGMKNLLPVLKLSAAEALKAGTQFKLTTEEVRRATEANVAFQQAGRAIDVVWKDIAVSMAPVLRDAADALPAVIGELRKDFLDLGEDGSGAFRSIARDAADLYDNLSALGNTSFGRAIKGLADFSSGVGQAALDLATTDATGQGGMRDALDKKLQEDDAKRERSRRQIAADERAAAETRRKIAEAPAVVPVKPKLDQAATNQAAKQLRQTFEVASAGAALKGSREAHAIETRFKMDPIAANFQKQQLDKLAAIEAHAKRIAEQKPLVVKAG